MTHVEKAIAGESKMVIDKVKKNIFAEEINRLCDFIDDLIELDEMVKNTFEKIMVISADRELSETELYHYTDALIRLESLHEIQIELKKMSMAQS